MAELTRHQINCCRGLASCGGRVDDAEIIALCALADRYVELRERIMHLRRAYNARSVNTSSMRWEGFLSELDALLIPDAEEEPHHGE